MKITVLPELNPIDVIRRAGYGQVLDRRASEPSWSRRLGSGFYPRFHAYISQGEINLHLDQKQASYEGYSAHSGEYGGEAVEREGGRIIEAMAKLRQERFSAPTPPAEEKKKGLFGRFFGD